MLLFRPYILTLCGLCRLKLHEPVNGRALERVPLTCDGIAAVAAVPGWRHDREGARHRINLPAVRALAPNAQACGTKECASE